MMSENCLQATISNEELNVLDLKHFEGEIIVIEDKVHVPEICAELRQADVLGFDTETRPAFKKGTINKVALLQLSTERKAYLFRINKIGLQKEVCEILADPKITKVGVAIRDDIKTLQKAQPFKAGGFIELQEFVKDFKIENFSLKKLTGIVLGFRISKSQRLSNWEADQLSEGQRNYAATDSWTSLLIYRELLQIQRKN